MLNKIFKYLSMVVFAVGAILAIIFFVSNQQASRLENELEAAKNLPSEVKVERVGEIADTWGGTVLNFAIILLVVVAAIALISGLVKFVKSMIESRQGLITNLISVGIIALVIILGFSMASDVIPKAPSLENLDFEVTNTISKRVGSGLQIMYIFFGLAIFGALYTELSKIWR
ncbi:MAG: hypothetical protein ACQES0_01825 [Bacteroidota bacterium]